MENLIKCSQVLYDKDICDKTMPLPGPRAAEMGHLRAILFFNIFK